MQQIQTYATKSSTKKNLLITSENYLDTTCTFVTRTMAQSTHDGFSTQNSRSDSALKIKLGWNGGASSPYSVQS